MKFQIKPVKISIPYCLKYRLQDTENQVNIHFVQCILVGYTVGRTVAEYVQTVIICMMYVQAQKYNSPYALHSVTWFPGFLKLKLL
jgi:hypothetical protein